MKTLLIAAIAAAVWTVPTSEDSIDGWTTYYDYGVMEQVAANRGVELPPGYSGYAVLNRKGDLFRTIWIEWEDATVDGPFKVIDCAAKHHFLAREKAERRRVLEVSAELAAERGFYGVDLVEVTVHFSNPERKYYYECRNRPCPR